MNAPLYEWPRAAQFGRAIPKTKFYEHTRISSRVRDRFVSEIQRITWAYKLADETIHLRGTSAVPEIQIFEINVKDEDVSNDVLSAIDKSIPFPIIFEISRSQTDHADTRVVASYKQLGGNTPRIGAYFTTGWLPADTPRSPLPPALDLAALYAGLLAPLMPVPPRPGEELSAAVIRLEQTRKLEREVAGLEKKLRTEPQLNRKIELRRQLRDRSAALTVLNDPEISKTKDRQWTS